MTSTETFDVREDDTIALKNDTIDALLTLPPNESKATPEAVEIFLKSTGLEFSQN